MSGTAPGRRRTLLGLTVVLPLAVIALVAPAKLHAGPLRSTCRSVLYIGDSTSEGVISTNYLPDAADREKPQLRAVGVTSFIPEISGARATMEHYKGEMSGMDVVDRYVSRGFLGC